jgi:hypothetical protein
MGWESGIQEKPNPDPGVKKVPENGSAILAMPNIMAR